MTALTGRGASAPLALRVPQGERDEAFVRFDGLEQRPVPLMVRYSYHERRTDVGPYEGQMP
jgi:hypothetical protein